MELIVYILLILTSTVGLAFIIERGLALRWSKVLPPSIEAAVESCQTAEDVPMLRRVCQQHNSPLGRLLLVAADHLDWPKSESIDAVQTRARHEITRLERGLVVLEIIIGIAPLLGLSIDQVASRYADLSATEVDTLMTRIRDARTMPRRPATDH